MYIVYILQSGKDKSYYVGQTKDITGRLVRHNSGRERYTKLRTPWKLVHREEFETRMEAVRREKEIKSKKSRIYIERLIANALLP